MERAKHQNGRTLKKTKLENRVKDCKSVAIFENHTHTNEQARQDGNHVHAMYAWNRVLTEVEVEFKLMRKSQRHVCKIPALPPPNTQAYIHRPGLFLHVEAATAEVSLAALRFCSCRSFTLWLCNRAILTSEIVIWSFRKARSPVSVLRFSCALYTQKWKKQNQIKPPNQQTIREFDVGEPIAHAMQTYVLIKLTYRQIPI